MGVGFCTCFCWRGGYGGSGGGRSRGVVGDGDDEELKGYVNWDGLWEREEGKSVGKHRGNVSTGGGAGQGNERRVYGEGMVGWMREDGEEDKLAIVWGGGEGVFRSETGGGEC